ncbi:MAG: ATP-dependent helicase, partial [Actinomycetia bacterium]|nr:ATP-dependent helicase [Actinomycetes bacterium]
MRPVSRLPRPALRDSDDLVAALQIPFSDEQLAAITAPLEPTVVIAGAGSGKTTVMAARVVWLVGSGQVQPGQVLGLTFTRKAAAELAHRVRSALVRAGVLATDDIDDAGEQVILTYDSFAARLVSEHGLWLGYESDPTMITGAARHRLAARVVGAAAGPFEQLSRLQPASVIDRVLALDGHLQSHLVSDQALDEQTRSFLLELARAPKNRYRQTYASVRRAEATARERRELASLARAYADLKRRLGFVEFSDQMAAAARLAAAVPRVGYQLREQFRIVLLDEYQDTSSAQASLLAHLFSGAPGTGRGHPVTAVGDPFQAIYGWRGAAPSNIMQFPSDFPRRDGSPAAVLPLTVNRRSGPRILEVANRLAGPLRADASLSYGLSENLLQAPGGTPPGAVETAWLPTWPDEVDWLADRVEHIHTSGEATSWSQIAVLTRRNQDIGAVYATLRERDIPAEIVGLGGLLSVPEVADVVSTLRLVDDVTANPDLVRLLTGPRWAIGSGDLELLGRRARELADTGHRGPTSDDDPLGQALTEAVAEVDPSELVSLSEALTDLGDGPFSETARERFAMLGAELEMLRRHAGEPVTDLVRRVVATLGLEAELVTRAGSGSTAQLGAFTDAVAAYTEVDTDASLKGLLGFLDAEVRFGSGLDQATPAAADSVQLLTIHKAKGLEWDVVLLPALCDKTFPSDRVTDNWVTSAAMIPAELRGDAASVPQLDQTGDAGFNRYQSALKAENRRSEDRLAYVAVTRARRLLIGSGHGWRAGDQRQRQPSPYLQALEETSERLGRATRAPVPPENPLQAQVLPV